jgi:diphosphomevalonate decarboxylase
LLAGQEGTPQALGSGFAPANIALCKYWGKRDDELNLPMTSSLSVSLGALGTRTDLSVRDGGDEVLLDGELVPPADSFAARITSFLDLIRSESGPGFRVATQNAMPTAAGLASSASGFAALVLALKEVMGWDLDSRALSMLARLGSGSACRSLFSGFVEWHVGVRDDGMDSYAEPIDCVWPDFRIAPVTVSAERKSIGSREAMRRTRDTSRLYEAWPAQVAEDLLAIRAALRERDFVRLGETAEANALAMHATMMASRPAVLYWRPETLETIRRAWRLREERGIPVYCTMDAGPNVKLIFLRESTAAIESEFDAVEIINPFETATTAKSEY